MHLITFSLFKYLMLQNIKLLPIQKKHFVSFVKHLTHGVRYVKIIKNLKLILIMEINSAN